MQCELKSSKFSTMCENARIGLDKHFAERMISYIEDYIQQKNLVWYRKLGFIRQYTVDDFWNDIDLIESEQASLTTFSELYDFVFFIKNYRKTSETYLMIEKLQRLCEYNEFVLVSENDLAMVSEWMYR